MTYDDINQHNLNLNADRFTPEKFDLVLNCLVGLASLRSDLDTVSRAQLPRGLRRESTTSRLLGLWV